MPTPRKPSLIRDILTIIWGIIYVLFLILPVLIVALPIVGVNLLMTHIENRKIKP